MSSNDQAANRLSMREAIRAKRAVCNYQPASVPANIVEAILDAGRHAQSSKNDQP